MEQKLNIIIGREQIASRVSELAGHISSDYHGKNPLFLCVLKGSFIFMADLLRELDIPVEIDFIQVSSYGNLTQSSGKIDIRQDISGSIEGRDVLVIEDIVDTGLSLSFLINLLSQRNPASVRVCALMDKPMRRQVPVTIDFLGFTIPDEFVVGYGIDLADRYRHLPDICTLA